MLNTQSPIAALDQVTRRRGAALLLDVLRSEGVRYVFGNPGTTELPLIDALIDAPDISYIWGLQEASVVAMADGYAQAACRPGFVNLHTAGGLGHGLGSLLNASVSGTPLVVTAGQQDSRHTITDPLLFGDLVGIARPAVKWAQEVQHADQLPLLVRRAFHDCSAPPTGPVFLALPMDVMEEMTSVGIAEVSTIDRAAVAGSLDRLADHLAAIAPGKLAIVAGDEISASNAAAETVRLAEAFGAPVYGSSWPLHIPFPTSHPLWAGNLPTKAREIRTFLDQTANWLIDRFIERGTVEFIDDLIAPVTAIATLQTLGLPGRYWEKISNVFHRMAGHMADVDEMAYAVNVELPQLRSMIVAELLDRRAHPRDDVATAIAQIEVDGRLITKLAHFRDVRTAARRSPRYLPCSRSACIFLRNSSSISIAVFISVSSIAAILRSRSGVTSSSSIAFNTASW